MTNSCTESFRRSVSKYNDNTFTKIIPLADIDLSENQTNCIEIILEDLYELSLEQVEAKRYFLSNSFFDVYKTKCNIVSIISNITSINPLTTNVPHHIEPSQLTAN